MIQNRQRKWFLYLRNMRARNGSSHSLLLSRAELEYLIFLLKSEVFKLSGVVRVIREPSFKKTLNVAEKIEKKARSLATPWNVFLGIDESTRGRYTTIGCLLAPIENLPDYEGEYIKTRIEERVWGEIKWGSLSSSYFSKYRTLIRNYLSHPDVTFHSWTYEHPTRDDIDIYYEGDTTRIIYRHAYLLIRSIIWKCRNTGYRGSFYIVPDTTGNIGAEEYKMVRELLVNDSRISPPPQLDFCDQGNSQICGALQVADVCAGATTYVYMRAIRGIRTAQDRIVGELQDINNGIPINYSYPTLPRMDQFKIHHCFFKTSLAPP